MTRTLFRRNLRQHLSLLVALCGGVLVFEAFLVWVSSYIGNDPMLVTTLQQMMPPAIRSLMQAQFGQLSSEGMTAFGFRHPVVLTGAIAVMTVVATIPAAERESGFLDLVLSRPLDRRRYMAGVIALMLLIAVAAPVCLWVGLALGRALVNIESLTSVARYLHPVSNLGALLAAVGGATLWVASGARRRGPAVAWSVGVLLVLFTLDMLSALWEPLRTVRWISPFHYFKPVQGILPGGPGWSGTLVLSVAALVATLLALVRFDRQDL